MDLRRRGAQSSTSPPPIVTTGENIRIMKRSPGRSSIGLRRTIRTKADEPGLDHGRVVERAYFCLYLGCAGMEMHRRSIFQRLC